MLEKSTRLEKINADGKMYSVFVQRAQNENEDLRVKITALDVTIQSIQGMVKNLITEIDALKSKPVSDHPESHALRLQKETLESQLSELQLGSRDSANDIREKIAAVSHGIEEHRAVLAQIEHNKKAGARIEELKAEERKLAGEYEKVDRDAFLCDLFVKTKVSMLTEKINSRFEFTRFVLFEDQINGGISETCRVMVNGIPYENLNNAMRIQSGMDVIRTMQKHYGVMAPCWIDNRESIVELPKMDCQVISLVVSAEDKTLRIEMENANVQRNAA